jgi:hypothetical protein
MALREDFPKAGDDYAGGQSDGWQYTTRFAGSSLTQSYEMLKAFLAEEGYDDLPLPADVKELLAFRAPKSERQFRLFQDNGYVHNPIKITFPGTAPSPKTLELRVFNDKEPGHLLRFYGLKPKETTTKD